MITKDKRDIVLGKLKENGIDARGFFIPLSEMAIYREYSRKCIKSKEVSERGLNLPTTHTIGLNDINKIKKLITSTM